MADDGNVLVADAANKRVLVYDTPIIGDTIADRVFGQGGDFTTDTGHCNQLDPGPTSSGFCEPCGLAVDADGSVYVADSDNHRVLAFDAAGTGDPAASRVLGQTSFAHGGRESRRRARPQWPPGGLAIDRSATPARLYVADRGNNRVLAWADAAGFASGAPADLVIGQPDFGASGCDRGGRSALTLCGPSGLAVDQAGRLYVADNENSRVLEYDTPFATDSTADRVFGQNGNFATDTCSVTGLCKPRGVALDGAGNLYVADSQNEPGARVRCAALTDATADRVFGQRGSFATTGCNQGGRDAGSLCAPTGVAVDANGNLYVADPEQQPRARVRSAAHERCDGGPGVRSAGGLHDRRVQPVPGDPNTFCSPYGVLTDGAGNLYIADATPAASSSSTRRSRPGMPTRTASSGSWDGRVGLRLRGPRAARASAAGAIAIDATGNLYVADSGGNRVLSYDTPLPLTPSAAKAARKCQQTIVKASAAFVQATSSTLQKCEDGKVKGKLAACPDAKTTTALGKVRTKLTRRSPRRAAARTSSAPAAATTRRSSTSAGTSGTARRSCAAAAPTASPTRATSRPASRVSARRRWATSSALRTGRCSRATEDAESRSTAASWRSARPRRRSRP